MPPRTSNKVKVHVRIRPTNNFASDMIGIGRDNRVCDIIEQLICVQNDSLLDN